MHLFHSSIHSIKPRIRPVAAKAGETYLGHLYSMEDLAVYGWISPSRLKIIIALALTDAVVRDQDVLTVYYTVSHTSQS